MLLRCRVGLLRRVVVLGVTVSSCFGVSCPVSIFAVLHSFVRVLPSRWAALVLVVSVLGAPHCTVLPRVVVDVCVCLCVNIPFILVAFPGRLEGRRSGVTYSAIVGAVAPSPVHVYAVIGAPLVLLVELLVYCTVLLVSAFLFVLFFSLAFFIPSF